MWKRFMNFSNAIQIKKNISSFTWNINYNNAVSLTATQLLIVANRSKCLIWVKVVEIPEGKKIKHTKRYDQLKNCEESLMSAKYENSTASMILVKRQQSLNKG